MCVEDYQFRHYTALRPKQCRRFLFINEDQIEKTFLVNISQFQENGQVALCKIIFYLSSKGLPINNRKFYWPKFNISVEPGDYCKVPFSALDDKQIMFHSIVKSTDVYGPLVSAHPLRFEGMYQTKENLIEASECRQRWFNSLPQQICPLKQIQRLWQQNEEKNLDKQFQRQEEGLSKRIKQPQRQIREVIIAVKKWRKLYSSKTLNLTKAAKVIGISKKSLDDYYLVIRVGDILEFDYQANLDSKMGDLRAFIRNFDYKVTGKLSKEVKCFQLVPDFDVDQILPQKQNNQTNFDGQDHSGSKQMQQILP